MSHPLGFRVSVADGRAVSDAIAEPTGCLQSRPDEIQSRAGCGCRAVPDARQSQAGCMSRAGLDAARSRAGCVAEPCRMPKQSRPDALKGWWCPGWLGGKGWVGWQGS